MANLKELRNRITSVSSTMQITSAMKMVAAAKLKKAQDAITEMRPYAQKLEEILVNVSSTLDASENEYAREADKVERVLLIAISSNRGLCGAFNANVVKKVQAYENESKARVEVICVGRKGMEIMTKRGSHVVDDYNDFYSSPYFEDAKAIAETLMEHFTQGKYQRVELIYNRFVNAATQEVQVEQFLPVRQPETEEDAAGDYIYEPGKMEILEDLIPRSLKTQLFKALLDSLASEHGARMTAMHQATDNAKDLKRDLSLDYNKARQAAITNEILEITAGANALNG